MKFFIIVRILDILTTLYGVNHGQRELNPFNRGLLNNQWVFVLFQVFLIFVVAGLYKFPLIKTAVNIFTWVNLAVVLMNITLIVLTFLEI